MVRPSVCIPVAPDATLQWVEREYHTRRRGCYLAVVRFGPLLVSQKLCHLVEYINALAPDPASKVSLPALHQICNSDDNKVCGWSKHMYKVRFVPLESIRDAFEAERDRKTASFILGEPGCYTLGPAR